MFLFTTPLKHTADDVDRIIPVSSQQIAWCSLLLRNRFRFTLPFSAQHISSSRSSFPTPASERPLELVRLEIGGCEWI